MNAWPLLSIPRDTQQPPQLLVSARHLPANVNVLSIPLVSWFGCGAEGAITRKAMVKMVLHTGKCKPGGLCA